MSEKRNMDFNSRRDLEIIAGLIPEKSRVLDLGCGDGIFLRQLKEKKNTRKKYLSLKDRLHNLRHN